MQEKVVDWLYNLQSRWGILKEEERSLYEYAYRLLLSRILIYSIIIALGIITGNWLEMFSFLLPFVILRQYVGGIHLKRSVSCICVSGFLIFICGKYLAINLELGITFCIVWLIAIAVMGIMKKIDAYFMAKEFQKVIQKKRMWSYVSKQMGYRNGNEIEVLYPLCCKRIQFDTLYDAALAAYGYDIKKRMEKLRMKVVIMYGGNELFAAKSVSLVKEKCVSECEVYAYDNMGHSEVLSLHPEKLCEIIRK